MQHSETEERDSVRHTARQVATRESKTDATRDSAAKSTAHRDAGETQIAAKPRRPSAPDDGLFRCTLNAASFGPVQSAVVKAYEFHFNEP